MVCTLQSLIVNSKLQYTYIATNYKQSSYSVLLGGSGGMPPRKILKNRNYEVESGGNFSQ